MTEEAIYKIMKESKAIIPEGSTEPTVLSLMDTIEAVKKKNPHWTKDPFCCSIVVWASKAFLPDHVKEICDKEFPDLWHYCVEYRETGMLGGKPYPDGFYFQAIDYLFGELKKEKISFEPFSTSPVNSSFWQMEKQDNLPKSK